MTHSMRLAFFVCLGFLHAGPVAAAEPVSFQGAQLWPAPKTITVSGLLSKPVGPGPFPAVVLLPNCGGPGTVEFVTFWPDYLNQLGYVTLNVDHFTPRKAAKCTKKFKPNAKTIAQDAYGALGYLAGLPDVDKSRIGVLGSSLGALAIHWFTGFGKATSEGLKFAAAVSLYGSHCKKVSPNAGMIPTLIIQGDQERGTASCKALSRRPELSVTILANTYHGFDKLHAGPLKNGKLKEDIAGNKLLYSKSATEKAQSLVRNFLEAKLATTTARPAPEAPAGDRLPNIGGKDPYVAVSRRDTDSDGKVSLAEWDKSPGLFAKIDANGDGFITPQEFHDRWKSRQ